MLWGCLLSFVPNICRALHPPTPSLDPAFSGKDIAVFISEEAEASGTNNLYCT